MRWEDVGWHQNLGLAPRLSHRPMRQYGCQGPLISLPALA
jgi:hypothetical protein